MLCHRVRLYTTLRAPGLIMLAQSFLFALCGQVVSPSATFLGSNKGQENKGQGAPPHAGGIFVSTHIRAGATRLLRQTSFPPAHSFMVPYPSACTTHFNSKPFGWKSTSRWVSEAIDTAHHLPQHDSRSTTLSFYNEKAWEKSKLGFCLCREWND